MMFKPMDNAVPFVSVICTVDSYLFVDHVTVWLFDCAFVCRILFVNLILNCSSLVD